MVTAFWIIYGAMIALRMGMFTQTAISLQEGLLWLARAALLGGLAYFKESFTRKGSEHAITGLREQLIKLQGFSEGTASAMGRSLARMEALPGTTPKGEEIVDELEEGLKEFRETIRALAESTSRPRIAPVTFTRGDIGAISLLVGVMIIISAMTIGRAVNQFSAFPSPLSPAQMSDLADRLRNESPQRVMIVREADHRSIALAEQFRKIFASAHWVLVTPPRPPNNGSTLVRGLVVWRAPTDYQALVFSRALYITGLPYETRTDVEFTNSGYFELSISDGWFQPGA